MHRDLDRQRFREAQLFFFGWFITIGVGSDGCCRLCIECFEGSIRAADRPAISKIHVLALNPVVAMAECTKSQVCVGGFLVMPWGVVRCGFRPRSDDGGIVTSRSSVLGCYGVHASGMSYATILLDLISKSGRHGVQVVHEQVCERGETDVFGHRFNGTPEQPSVL